MLTCTFYTRLYTKGMYLPSQEVVQNFRRFGQKYTNFSIFYFHFPFPNGRLGAQMVHYKCITPQRSTSRHGTDGDKKSAPRDVKKPQDLRKFHGTCFTVPLDLQRPSGFLTLSVPIFCHPVCTSPRSNALRGNTLSITPSVQP